ncbi:hypothetical protein B0G57_112126 [Trinickia symbiotica]|uniref:Phage tail protein n=1 Tax=Trinickia symbiotica TaxID=863227 RepID=A0A2N7X0A9_9BURK|nr:hypothetical protein [Trinickia symbiotica]PMS35070.1 hypothetical protein C0Z20_20230 [Trinickia symbiotica]PPK43579.1 hypothetical protein B0G57_112126 [Trinickia symbiotica]
MNLHEQIGALEASIDQINELNRAAQAALAAAAQREPEKADAADSPAQTPEIPETRGTSDDKPTLRVGRPSQNELTLTIGSQSVTLRPEQIGQLVEELANARASMLPEVPTTIAQGWQFVSTKNPIVAVQKQANGDRLLVARHTGHGWVPFTFSPDMVIQLYMMLSK